MTRGFSTAPTRSDHSSNLSIHGWRERLACRGRSRQSAGDFLSTDLLFRGFRVDELDDEGKIDADTLRLPDLSCNWDRFSIPHDVRFRMPGCESDGCYSISVEVARYKEFATPVHDPLCDCELENFAHVEVRELYETEPVTFAPPKDRKKRRKVLRLEWRVNLVNKLRRIIEPGENVVN